MKITVKVHPKSKEEKIIKTGERELEVYFNVPPEKGRANKKTIEMLAEYFQVSLSDVTLILGSTSKIKVFEVNNGF